MILAGFDREARWATIKVQIHPMIGWIWVGGVVVVLGGLVALWPQSRRADVTVGTREAAAIAGASGAGHDPTSG